VNARGAVKFRHLIARVLSDAAAQQQLVDSFNTMAQTMPLVKIVLYNVRKYGRKKYVKAAPCPWLWLVVP
jgi:hypothetical protein